MFDRVSLSGSAILYTRLALISNVATLLIGAASLGPRSARTSRGGGCEEKRALLRITSQGVARFGACTSEPARSKEVATLRDVLASTHISQTASSCARAPEGRAVRATELAFPQ